MRPSWIFAILRGGLLSLALVSTTSADSWTYSWASPLPQGSDLFGLDFVSSSSPIGWVVGAQGAAARTLDGGVTWLERGAHATTRHTLRDVVAVGADVAVACDGGGALWRTVDGGVTWYEAYQEPNHRDLLDLDQPAPGTLVAIGDRVIIRSTDAGASWTRIVHEDVEGELTDQYWFDAENAVFSGVFGMFTTSDGGVTVNWSTVDIADLPFVCVDMAGVEGFAVAWDIASCLTFYSGDGGASWELRDWGGIYGIVNDVVIAPSGTVLAGTDLGDIWASEDGGYSWGLRYDDPQSSAAIVDLDLRAGGAVYYAGGFGELAYSLDEATSFTVATTCVGGHRRCDMDDLDRLADDTLMGIATGFYNATLITSVDQGLSWSETTAPLILPGTGQLGFRTPQIGVIGGEDVIVRTLDGGGTWQTTDPNTIPGLETGTVDVKDIAHRDGTTWFAAVALSAGSIVGTVIASDDDGLTWERRDVGLPTDVPYVDVKFLDSDTGFLATSAGVIYETLDGGASWTLLSDGLYGVLDWLVEMVWLDSNTVLMASTQIWPGLPGGIWRSMDRGTTWQGVWVGYPVVDLSMLDATTAVAVRKPDGNGYGASAFVTGDAGTTWTEVVTPMQQRYAGYDQWIGASSGVCDADGFVLGGTCSELIRAFGDLVVDVADGGAGSPLDGQWSPGALRVPSPVGARFEIGVRAPVEAGAQLVVLDVRGRLVRVLPVSRAATGEGWRWLSWDGRDGTGRSVAPGVYYAHLSAAGGRGAVERMVLVR